MAALSIVTPLEVHLDNRKAVSLLALLEMAQEV